MLLPMALLESPHKWPSLVRFVTASEPELKIMAEYLSCVHDRHI